MSAESQGVGQNILHVCFSSLIRYIVQIQFRIRLLQTYCRRDESLGQHLCTNHSFQTAGCTQQVTCHTLCGTYRNLGVITEYFLDSDRFKGIVVRRACAVCIDVIDIVRRDAGILDGHVNGLCSTFTLRIRRCDVICIGGGTVSYDFTVDLSTSVFSVFQFFQDQESCALAQDESASFHVERDGSSVRICRRVHGCHIGKAGKGYRSQNGFCTACHNNVVISVLDISVSFSYIVGTCCTCRNDTEADTFRIEFHGDIPCDRIRHHHRNQQCGCSGQITLLHALFYFMFHGGDAADTRASVYAETIRIHVFAADDPTVFNSFPGSHQRILVCDIQSPGSSLVAKIEILDFRRQRHLVAFQIESGDLRDAVLSSLDRLPHGVHIISNRRYHADPGHNYSLFHLTFSSPNTRFCLSHILNDQFLHD